MNHVKWQKVMNRKMSWSLVHGMASVKKYPRRTSSYTHTRATPFQPPKCISSTHHVTSTKTLYISELHSFSSTCGRICMESTCGTDSFVSTWRVVMTGFRGWKGVFLVCWADVLNWMVCGTKGTLNATLKAVKLGISKDLNFCFQLTNQRRGKSCDMTHWWRLKIISQSATIIFFLIRKITFIFHRFGT